MVARAARIVAVVLLVLGASSSRAAAADRDVGEIRDVRPRLLERGDTLVVEAAGISPGGDVRVQLEGRAVGGPAEEARRLAAASLPGRVASGDRVLVDAAAIAAIAPAGGRLVDLRVAVTQTRGGTETRWRSRPGDLLALELFPSTLRAQAEAARAAAASGTPALRAVAPYLPALVLLAVGLVLHLLVAPLTGLVVVWERKISGRMQSRLGPNRVGPRGWLQWLADAIKMITKEDLVPADADRTLFRLAPYLMWMSIFATFIVLPLSATAIVADLDVGILYLASITSFSVIAILLGGWASNSKWSLLGGMRSAAQIVSYELPASLALLQAALLAGTLSPQGIVRAQGGLPHEWLVFSNPLSFACFFVYFISALAEGNRTPFDLPEAESELVSGYNTEYSGFRFGIFSLAEWTNMYVLGAVVSTVFLGGWNLPFVPPERIAGSLALEILSMAVMIAKVVTLVFVIIWIRWTLPRFRVDQMMALCWKYFIPISFAAFLGTAAWVWLVAAVPALGAVMRWLVFLTGGVGLGSLFLARVVANFRATKLLYVGDRQFNWPFVERHIEKR